MGKRKAKRAPPKKRFQAKLERVFSCPLCHHEKAVECKMDRAHEVGILVCRICGVRSEHNINKLSQPIDVFAEWVDAMDAAGQLATE